MKDVGFRGSGFFFLVAVLFFKTVVVVSEIEEAERSVLVVFVWKWYVRGIWKELSRC